ncbi:unnamed protein product [Rotaria sp. Silwood1]|nr:unnamed protein product [Rotaria sp. Silwood1]
MQQMHIDDKASTLSQFILPIVFENQSFNHSPHHQQQLQKQHCDRARFFYRLHQKKKQRRLQHGPLPVRHHQQHVEEIKRHNQEQKMENKLITAIVGSSIARNISVKNIENETNEVRLRFKSGSDCADALSWLESTDGQFFMRGVNQLVFILDTNDIYLVGAFQTVERIDYTIEKIRRSYPGISKLKLNQTEKIRKSLYDDWRRHCQKIADDLSESHQDSVEKVNESDKENKVELLLPKSVNKSTASDESPPRLPTRATVQQESNTPKIVEASFILTLKDWKDIYNSSTREMEPGWTDMMYEKVRSCNFRCTLAFKNHHVSLEESRKINSSFFRFIATCKTPSCKRTFEDFIRDEPTYRDSIVVHIRAVGDEDHSADEKAVPRHLNGKARLEVGKAANAIGCLKVFQQKVEKANEEMVWV